MVRAATKTVATNLYEPSLQILYGEVTIHVAFGLRPPHSVAHLCGNWLQGIDKKIGFQVWVGAIAVCWSICLSRNDIIFDKKE